MSEKIEKYRKEIAEIDSQILKLAKSRLNKAEQIGGLKKQLDLPVTNLPKEADVIDRSLKLAKEIGLNDEFTSQLMGMMIAEAVKVQGNSPKSRSSYLYDIFEEVLALEAKGEKIIRLELGEPDLTSPIELKDALRDALYKNNYIGYASAKGILELRQTLAETLNNSYGSDISAEQILITPGGKFAIFSAILSLVSLGDHVTIPEPTWPVYGTCVNLAKGRVDTIKTRFEDSWDIDMSQVAEAFSVKPKLFVLCSPNNPSGKVFSGASLRELVNLAEKRGTYILSDEVYCAYSMVPFESILQVSNSNFIYVNSFSKRYGMTGWRIGYAVSDAKTIARMQNILQVSVTCVPDFVQRAALKALKMSPKPYDEFAGSMKQRVDVACKELDKIPLPYIRPNGGMYVFPRYEVEGFSSYEFAHKLLETDKVSVSPGEAFGDYPEHFRISLGTGLKNIVTGIRRIGKAVKRWEKKS